MLFHVYACFRINGMVEGDVNNSELFGFDFYYHGNDALLIFNIVVDIAMVVLVFFSPILEFALMPVSLVLAVHSALFLLNDDLEAEEEITPGAMTVTLMAVFGAFVLMFIL